MRQLSFGRVAIMVADSDRYRVNGHNFERKIIQNKKGVRGQVREATDLKLPRISEEPPPQQTHFREVSSRKKPQEGRE